MNFPHSLLFLLSSSAGASGSSKKSKDKSGISRSQSQRPAENHHSVKFTLFSSRVQKEKEEGGEAEARRGQDPPPEDRSETKAANNQPGPSNDKEDVLPPAGSSAALQPKACVSPAGADLDTKEMPAPPPGQQV